MNGLENVIEILSWNTPKRRRQLTLLRHKKNVPLSEEWSIKMRGNKVRSQRTERMAVQFESRNLVRLSHDWVLFCDLFGGAMNLQKTLPIPFDISHTDEDEESIGHQKGFAEAGTIFSAKNRPILNKHNACGTHYHKGLLRQIEHHVKRRKVMHHR